MSGLDQTASTTRLPEPDGHHTEIEKAETVPADRRVIVQAAKLLGMISRARELNEPLMGLVSSTVQHRKFERLVDEFRKESRALGQLKACSPTARRAQEKALLACIELQNDETSRWDLMQTIPPHKTIAF